MKPNHTAISPQTSYGSSVFRMGYCTPATGRGRGDLTYQHLPFYPIEKHVADGALTLLAIYNMYMAHTTSSSNVSISSTLDPRACVCTMRLTAARATEGHKAQKTTCTWITGGSIYDACRARGVWEIAGWVRERHESVSARVFYLLESRLFY